MKLKAQTTKSERNQRRQKAREGLSEWVVILPLLLGAVGLIASVLKVFAGENDTKNSQEQKKDALDWWAFGVEIFAVVGAIVAQGAINLVRLSQLNKLIKKEESHGGIGKGQAALGSTAAGVGVALEIASATTFLTNSRIASAILGILASFSASALGGLAQKRLEDEYSMITIRHKAIKDAEHDRRVEADAFKQDMGIGRTTITDAASFTDAINGLTEDQAKQALEHYRAALADRKTQLTFADRAAARAAAPADLEAGNRR